VFRPNELSPELLQLAGAFRREYYTDVIIGQEPVAVALERLPGGGQLGGFPFPPRIPVVS